MTDIIIQCATKDSIYHSMCYDHMDRHIAYAEKWGFAFHKQGQDEPDSWFKLKYLKTLMESLTHPMNPNYDLSVKASEIILLDADAFITDFNVDMRSALPPWAWLGLVKHQYAAYGQATHWNVGMSYWRACPEAIKFLDDVLAMRQDAPEEQFAINSLLWGGRQEGFCDLPRQWNNNWHDMAHDGAVVMGFHGFMEPEMRREVMKMVAGKYPYDTL